MIFIMPLNVQNFLGIKLNKIEAEPNMISMLKFITHKLDEPIGDSSAYKHLFNLQKIKLSRL